MLSAGLGGTQKENKTVVKWCRHKVGCIPTANAVENNLSLFHPLFCYRYPFPYAASGPGDDLP